MIGETLGHYRILETLGAGGMGIVYRARDARLGRDVAIKVLFPQLLSDGRGTARFHREARALAALNHPNIAFIYGFEESNSSGALVMDEFCRNQSVGSYFFFKITTGSWFAA